MKLSIPGTPIAKMRARHARRGNFVQTYDAQEKEKIQTKLQIKDQANFSYHEKRYYFDQDEPLSVQMTFYTPTAKCDNRSEVNYKLWSLEYRHHRDVDNTAKFYLDCMNELVYRDDSQIVELYAKRVFSHEPRTEIEVTEIKVPKLTTSQKKVYAEFSPIEMLEFVTRLRNLDSRYFSSEIKNRTETHMQSFADYLIDFSKKYSKKLSKLSKLGDDENNKQGAN